MYFDHENLFVFRGARNACCLFKLATTAGLAYPGESIDARPAQTQASLPEKGCLPGSWPGIGSF
jgi:hypothetical protein